VMDPLRIAARAVFAYIVLLVLVRLSGKHRVTQANPFDFSLSLILGDLVDDPIWGEVDMSLLFRRRRHVDPRPWRLGSAPLPTRRAATRVESDDDASAMDAGVVGWHGRRGGPRNRSSRPSPVEQGR
jgi:hypothetical protein